MKNRLYSPLFRSAIGNSLSFAAAALLLGLCSTSSSAATLWWDGGTSTANSASDNASTATQNWLSGGNWDNGTSSAPVASWTAGDSAIFGGSAASQTTVAGTFTVGNLTFGQGAQGTGTSGTAYTLSGGTLTLSGGTIAVNTATVINSSLAGTAGLTKTGTATLTLGGNNSYTGATVINSGTLKVTPSAYTAYRYYKFTVSAKYGADGYNQFGELHYYNNGVWTAATAGSAAPTNGASGTEQYWGNVNDNKGANVAGFTKFGVGSLPYSLTYDFGSAAVFNSYNWSTANDSTPARNPAKWTVSGSNDNSNWTVLDDRSASVQTGPTATYTWSSPTGAYATVSNGTNDGATYAYPIPGFGNLPQTSAVQIASGATLDLNGSNQIVASLADSGVGSGFVTNSASTKSPALTLNAASGSTTFSGVISDSGTANAISLVKSGAGTQILAGANTYRGATTLNGGTLQLATGGQLGSGALTVTGGTFDLNGGNQPVALFTGTGGTVTNSAATDSTLTITMPAASASNVTTAYTSPGTGKLNLTVNPTSGGTASNFALANSANTFKGTITVNGTGSILGTDAFGLLGINTDGALGDTSNPIILNNGGALCNMFTPGSGGGWSGHEAFTIPATRTITVTGANGGVIRTGYADTCIIDSPIIGDGGLAKTGDNALTLGGSTSNSYAGTTTLGSIGKLILAKTDGAIAIPGNINISSTAWNGNSFGIVLAADEQIADTSVITWTAGGYGGSLRLNGHTETIGGLVSTATGLDPNIENRGHTDTASYGTGTVILNVTGSNSYNYNGHIRDMDGSNGGSGGAVAVTKTGSGTQIFSGTSSYTGATTVNGGVLAVDSSLAATPVSVTGTGTLAGTGSVAGAITVQSGGTLAPGVAGAGTLTASGGVTIGSGGTLSGSGNLAGTVTVSSGGTATGTGTVTGAVTVQADGTLSPGGNSIGNLNTNSSLTLAGNATFQLNKSGTTLTCDTISGFSSVTYGGTLTVTVTGDTPELGDSFQLFVPGIGGTYGGSFSAIVGLPILPGGLQWETTGLLGTGRITVVNYVSTPSFSPAAGGYIGAQSVTISSDSGSTIYYTTDGSVPTTSSSSGLSPLSGITIPDNSNMTLKAFAKKSGQADSPLAEAVYHTVTVATWNVDADGSWADTANWLNSVSPNGSGVPVDFSVIPQTAATTVNLDAGRTVGSMIFGNTNGNPWTLSSTTGSVLTLDTPSGTPSIKILDVNTTISAVLAGSQGLSKTGPGTLTLTAANNYGGTTAINGGVLSVSSFASNGNNSPLGTGPTLSFDGGTLRYTGGSVPPNSFNRAITLNAGGGTLDADIGIGYWFTTGVISGSGALTKTGAGQLIIQATNTYDGITYLNQGEIQMRDLSALGSTVGKTVVASGAQLCAANPLIGTVNEPLELNGNGGGNGALQANDGGTIVTYAGNVTLASDSGVGSTTGISFAISGPISGPGGLVKLTSNVVTLSGSASNTYSGVTTLGGNGKLILAKTGGAIAIPGDINISTTAWNGNNMGIVLGGNEQIADTAAIIWTSGGMGGTLRLNGHTETIGGLDSTATGLDPEIENRGFNDTGSYGTGTVIINTTGSNTYSYNGGFRDYDAGAGAGSGVLAITKTGTGTQILNGGMGNTGATAVNGGTLEIDCVSSAVTTTVASGATLKGTGATTGTLTINAGGTLAPGNGAGTFSAGHTTLNGIYACELDGPNADRLTVTGNLDLTASTLTITTLTAPSAGSYVIASYTGTLTDTFATVNGLPEGYSVQYDGTAKQIKLVKSGFAGWATTNGLSGNPGADFDHDGLADAVEYVLGTSPTTGNAGGPAASLVGGDLVFNFTRDHASMTPDLAVAVEVGSTLGTWPDVYQVGADTASSTPGIAVTNHGTYDTVTLTVALGSDTRKFARLRVTVTP